MKKLKYSEVKALRLKLLKEQNYICALCQEPIDEKEAVLDHDHKKGHIRAVLHRGCNVLEGKITNNLARSRITPTRLHNFLKNYESYVISTSEWLHPTYREKKK